MNASPIEKISKSTIKDPIILEAIRRLIRIHESNQTDDDGAVERRSNWATAAIEKVATDLLSSDPEMRRVGEAYLCVIADLLSIGWRVSVVGADLYVQKPIGEGVGDIRRHITSSRDRQLARPAVQKFIGSMEGWRTHQGKQVSIFSLIEDGRSLLNRVSEGRMNNASPVRPYVQLVTPKEKCKFTGLLLSDVWRYFRLTWSSPSESVPGRSAQFLVRDAASENHKVIGIFALSSAAIRLAARDQHIGWDSGMFVDEAARYPSASIARWAAGVVESALSEIYKTDLIAEGVLILDASPEEAPAVIERLKADSEKYRQVHRVEGASKSSSYPTDFDWESAAKSPLFRSKRAEQLAKLYFLKVMLRELMGAKPSKAGLIRLLSSAEGRKVLADITTLARSRTVGTSIADLTVCGSIAPYRHIAGGKLVAMLAVSPKVVALYNARYSGSVSVIASSMAGREVIRDSRLVFVGTTSLYGKRPNQYDRIRVPAEILGGRAGEAVRYQHLKRIERGGEVTANTQGVGSFHFSKETVSKLEAYHSSSRGVWHANRVFGEGTSPKLRGIRDGLASLGLKAESLMNHGFSRCVYGVSLVRNAKEVLLGLQKRPKYVLPMSTSSDSDSVIGEFWFERWAEKRLRNPSVRDLVCAETLVYPIVHTARAPQITTHNQQELFLSTTH